MDALRPILQQYRELFRSLSAGQRATALAVPLLIAVVFGALAFRATGESYVPLSWGKAFTAEERASAEQTLIKSGLTDYRRDGQRLLVPAAEVERYNAALLEGDSLPSNYAEELERQLDKQSIFTSERQSKAYRDLALKKELRRIIRAIPDVEDADVIWARGEAGRWPNRGGRVTATVSVRLRQNQELSPSMIQSLRTAVASMVPDLKTADVVVFDLKSGTSHVPGRDDDGSAARLARSRELAQAYRQKIGEALSYIPGVLVTVNVEADRVAPHGLAAERHAGERQSLYRGEPPWPPGSTHSQAIAERDAGSNRPRAVSPAGWPEHAWPASTADSGVTLASFASANGQSLASPTHAVQVSVQIPEDYYRAVAVKRGLPEGRTAAERAEFRKALDAIRAQEEKKAQATAAVLIPGGSPAGAVAVSSFVPVGADPPAGERPSSEFTSSTVAQLECAIGLGVLAVWVVWLRRRNEPTPACTEAARGASDSPAASPPNNGSVEVRRCDELTTAGEERRAQFIFDDLVHLNERAMQRLLEDVETSDWAVALKGAPEEFRRKLFGTVPPRTAELIAEEMESLGPVRVSDIDTAQQHVTEAVVRLGESFSGTSRGR